MSVKALGALKAAVSPGMRVIVGSVLTSVFLKKKTMWDESSLFQSKAEERFKMKYLRRSRIFRW
jgi:hypothetical protein